MGYPTGVKYVSLADSTGYGVAGRRCMLALDRAGFDVTWTPMVGGLGRGLYYGAYDGTGVGDPDLDRFCNRNIPYDVVIVHTVPEYFPFWRDAEPGRTIIGHTVWETTAIPAHWPALLNAVDHLIVPCGWNKTVFETCGVTVPIDVVPHIVDQGALAAAGRARAPRGDDYVFYTIGVWTRRKGLEATLTAFCEAFAADDPVTLLVKTTPHDLTAAPVLRRFRRPVARAVRRVTRRYRRPPRIRLLTDVMSESEIRALHLDSDCYVSLCRGEGWGFGAFDAATYGNPVVMTGFGGQLDYLDPDLAYLVDHDVVSVVNPPDPQSYSPDQRWAEPHVDHGARLLRGVAADPDAAARRGRALQSRVLARFSERPVVEALTLAMTRARRRLPDSHAGEPRVGAQPQPEDAAGEEPPPMAH